MDFTQTLEKAVLEHAAGLKRNPAARNGGPTKIPGFPDQLVWGTARQLTEKGYISTTSVGENGQIVIETISDEGSSRLEEMRKAAEEEEAKKQADYQKAVAEAKKNKKPFWKFWG